MSVKTVMILCLALFAVARSMPASKQAAPAEDMKTAETIYRSWAPSPLLGYRSAYAVSSAALGYRSAYTMPTAAIGYPSAYTMPTAAIGYPSAYTMPYAYRSAAIPAITAIHSGLSYGSPMAYSSILDADCL